MTKGFDQEKLGFGLRVIGKPSKEFFLKVRFAEQNGGGCFLRVLFRESETEQKTKHQRGGIYDTKKILLSVLAAVIMLSFPELSVSEIKEGSIEIEPFVGYYFLRHQSDRVGYGLRGGYNFTKNWGLEGAYDYAGSRAKFLHAALLYHLIPEKAFNPFIFVGVGDAHMKPGNDHTTRYWARLMSGLSISFQII